jgi:capsular exopolysaccharide synthesis family protein
MNQMSAMNAEETVALNPAPNEDSKASSVLRLYFAMLLRHRWTLLAIVVAAMLLGLIVTLLSTPQYTATSRIEISRQQAKVTNVEGLQSEDSGRDLEFYSTQYSLLEARTLAERVVRDMGLARSDEFFNAQGVDPSSIGEGSGATNRDARERVAIELLQENVSVSPIRGSALIDINYTSASPALSQRVANSWVDQFVRLSMERRFASTADARRFLESRLTELRSRLEQSERDVVRYASQQNIVRLSEEKAADGRTRTTRTLVAADVEALNEALAEATSQRVAAEGRMIAARGRSLGDATQQSGVAVNQLRVKRAEAAAELARMLAEFDAEYPPAKALRDQVKSLETAIAREEARGQSELVTQYDAARQREAGLRSRVEALLGRLNQQEAASIQFNIYQREADTNRELYDGLLQRYKEIGVAGVGVNNIAVVDRAVVPDKPSSPNLPLNLALALILGIVTATAAVLVLENLDESLRDPNRASELLSVPMLGAIPASAEDEARVLLADPKSSIYEAYLTVRSNLGFTTDHGVPRTFMVTSTQEAEGKSTTTLALATTLARAGKSVVLVDADMRRPAVHHYLDLPNKTGTSNFLSGDDNLETSVIATSIPNVSVLPGGPVPPSAAELLAGDRLLLLVRVLAERFDFVIVDSPPMLGLADATSISRSVEGVVYVIEAHRTPVRGVRSALDRLRAANARIFGIVMTKYRARDAGYGYGYGYGYGREDEDTDLQNER